VEKLVNCPGATSSGFMRPGPSTVDGVLPALCWPSIRPTAIEL
jgi:hypothetical protein